MWIVFVVFSLINSAYGYNSYQSFRAKPVSVNLDLQYYKTDANFDAGGSRESLLSGNSFQYINFASHLRWQFSNLAFLGGVNIGNSQSEDATFSRKNSIINRVDLGAEYLFMNDVWYQLFGRFNYSHPLEKIDYSGDTVLTSNGASEINPEIILNLDFEGDIYSFIKGGIIVRGEGLSTLGTYGVGSEYHFSDYGLGVSLLGQLTIKDDAHTQDATYRNNLNNRVDAGSKIFNAINPNVHNLEFNFNFQVGQQSLFKIYTGLPVMGSNTAAGYYAGVNMNWVLDYNPEFGSSTSSRPHPKKIQQSDVIFKEKTDDGVNQDYFKPVEPVSQDYIQQIEGSQKSLQEATTPDPDEEIKTKPIKKNPTKGFKIKLRKDHE